MRRKGALRCKRRYMTKETKERIHRIYGICLAVLIVVVGVCFALSCISIYQSGQSPFTRESIATHFARMAIPVYLCITGVEGGVVLSVAWPIETGKIKPRREAYVTLCKLREKLDFSAVDTAVTKAVDRESGKRRKWLIQAVVVTAVSLAISMAWCMMPNHFSVENLNEDVKAAVLMLAPYVLASVAIWMDTVYMWDISIARETKLVKNALAMCKHGAHGKEPAREDQRKLMENPRFIWAVRGVIMYVGIMLVILGIFNGGMADVLGKAVRICTECIGLG